MLPHDRCEWSRRADRPACAGCGSSWKVGGAMTWRRRRPRGPCPRRHRGRAVAGHAVDARSAPWPRIEQLLHAAEASSTTSIRGSCVDVRDRPSVTPRVDRVGSSFHLAGRRSPAMHVRPHRPRPSVEVRGAPRLRVVAGLTSCMFRTGMIGGSREVWPWHAASVPIENPRTAPARLSVPTHCVHLLFFDELDVRADACDSSSCLVSSRSNDSGPRPRWR